MLVIFGPFVLAIGVAIIQWAFFGLPPISNADQVIDVRDPAGFPAWLRITHFANFLLIVLLIRSGLQILADHPRLYMNVDCTPGTEWVRFTPVKVPTDRLWTSKDDSRHLSPWIGLPGHRHTVGMARHWHFLTVFAWLLTGLTFFVLLFATGQWRRIVPQRWSIIPDAWAVFVHYATLHLPPEPNAYFHYNALQKLTYFGVVFILAPLAILTGPSMSPALTARFGWYPKLPGNRQIGRSLHFLVMCGFLAFLIGHVAMVSITGLARNMNHIVVGTDTTGPAGICWGVVGIAVVIAVCAAAYWAAWRKPRLIQHAAKAVVSPVMKSLLDQAQPKSQFSYDRISPYFWANGKIPTSDVWQNLAQQNFQDFRLKVYGLVENPVELSLERLRKMDTSSQVTLHHCIQGWSGIAEWRGLPMARLIDLVRPTKEAQALVFHSFGEGGEGGEFYDSLPIANARQEQTLLAYEMNRLPLSTVHGAPLRLRVENQLGFKMVKWIRAIEFVNTVRSVGEGEGGYNEDHEFFGEVANI